MSNACRQLDVLSLSHGPHFTQIIACQSFSVSLVFIPLKFKLWISVKRGTPGPFAFEVMKCLRCLFMMAPTSINYNVEVALSFWHLPWYQLKLMFAGSTGSKNQVLNRLKIQFVELDFYKLIYQKFGFISLENMVCFDRKNK